MAVPARNSDTETNEERDIYRCIPEVAALLGVSESALRGLVDHLSGLTKYFVSPARKADGYGYDGCQGKTVVDGINFSVSPSECERKGHIEINIGAEYVLSEEEEEYLKSDGGRSEIICGESTYWIPLWSLDDYAGYSDEDLLGIGDIDEWHEIDNDDAIERLAPFWADQFSGGYHEDDYSEDDEDDEDDDFDDDDLYEDEVHDDGPRCRHVESSEEKSKKIASSKGFSDGERLFKATKLSIADLYLRRWELIDGESANYQGGDNDKHSYERGLAEGFFSCFNKYDDFQNSLRYGIACRDSGNLHSGPFEEEAKKQRLLSLADVYYEAPRQVEAPKPVEPYPIPDGCIVGTLRDPRFVVLLELVKAGNNPDANLAGRLYPGISISHNASAKLREEYITYNLQDDWEDIEDGE